MARGWHFTKLSLSSALLLYIFLAFALCIVPFFLSCLSCLCFVLFSCSRWSFVDVPLIFFLSSRPRTGLATTYITEYG